MSPCPRDPFGELDEGCFYYNIMVRQAHHDKRIEHETNTLRPTRQYQDRSYY